MRQALEMARAVQMSTLPASMPTLDGYEVCGTFRPAEPDRRRHLRRRGDRPGPARRARRRDRPRHRARAHGHADAGDAAHGVPPGRRPRHRVPAGQQPARRDARRRPLRHRVHRAPRPAAHELRFHSGGQGPILHFRAATGAFDATSRRAFPLGAMPLAKVRPPTALDLAPGDVVALLSDGFYEQAERRGRAVRRGARRGARARAPRRGRRGAALGASSTRSTPTRPARRRRTT